MIIGLVIGTITIAAMVAFAKSSGKDSKGEISWDKETTSESKHHMNAEESGQAENGPKDSFRRPHAREKMSENEVNAIKDGGLRMKWTPNIKVVLQINFPPTTRSAFMLLMRDDETKEIFLGLVDNRNDDWNDVIWVSNFVDENLELVDYPIPAEMDVVRGIQQKFRKFEPYWLDPSHRNQLLSRDEWLAPIALVEMQSGS